MSPKSIEYISRTNTYAHTPHPVEYRTYSTCLAAHLISGVTSLSKVVEKIKFVSGINLPRSLARTLWIAS